MPKFPFTNYHELNLDWILKKVNALFDASEENARTIRTYDSRLTSAEQTATSAETAATSAQQLADAAAANADNALSVAGTADSKADSALTAATDASSAVSGALTAAQEAQQTAGAAVATANDAAATAAGLESLANTANQNATAAVETAGTAVTTSNNAAAAAQTADQKAVAAQQTANSAQAAASTNAGNITTLQSNVTDLNRQISDVEESLKQANVVVFPTVQWVSGYVTPSGNSVDSSTAWKKTAPFTLPKGYTLRLEKATGYVGNAISAISSVDNNVYTNRYTGSSGNTVYEYTATTDLQIVVSASINADPVIYYYLNVGNIASKVATNTSNIAINTSNIAINKNAIIDLSCVVGGNIEFSWVNGYVSAGGVNYDNDSSWCKTPPFTMRKGQSIAFTANGYGANLCSMIARKNSDNTYTPLVKSRSGSVETYKYDFAEDMVVVLSCVANSQERTVVVNSKDENNINKIESFPAFSIFEKWGVIGDSFASGVFYDNTTSALQNHLAKSWGQILARESGNTCINFSKGGLWCASWLTDPDRGLPFLLSSEAQELYIIALGINDVGKLSTTQPLGTISDINDDYSQNPDTFYGNYGKIIGNIKTKAPKAKIIISTIPFTGESAMKINNAIIAIAGHYNLPCLYVHTDTFFQSDWFWNNMYDNHPKSFVYARMADAYNNMIGNSFIIDTSYWGDMFN